jgi:Tfp pilus assembly protein PilF
LLALLLLVIGGAGYASYRYLRAERDFQAAEAACGRRDFGQARWLLESYLNDWPDSTRAHFLLARTARRSGLPMMAEHQLETCQRLEGPTERIALERTLLEVQQGGISRATEARLRQQITQNHPDSLQILEALSGGCLISYRFAAALVYLNEWLQREPGNYQAYLWRSMAHERRLDFGSAADDARKAMTLEPDLLEAKVRLAQVLFLKKDFQESAELFEPLYARQPENPVVALGLARAQINLNQTQAAERILDELVRRYPNDAPVLLERGRLALQVEQAGAAERWLRRAAGHAPYDYQTNYTLFLCLRQLDQTEEARKVEKHLKQLTADSARFRELSERLQQYPYDLSVRCEIARIYLSEGQNREAVRWLRSALKIDPACQPASQLLADYYESSGQPAQAATYRRLAKGMEAASSVRMPQGHATEEQDVGLNTLPIPEHAAGRD